MPNRSKTDFRLDTVEREIESLRKRVHDAMELGHDAKLRLDAMDLDGRLRNIEAWINEQKGKEMQNRLIMGVIAAIISVVGAGVVEVIVRHV